ncbi:PspA/IM30 family protein, partial [Streptosporangium algeriense]
ELDRMGGGHDVELEIARMKAELGQGPAPKSAIEQGPSQQGYQQPQQPQQQPQGTQQFRQPGEGL